VVCMHCEELACALVCPADAIKKTANGVVQSALTSHCIGYSNCVLACPLVAYPRPADKYFGPLVSRLSGVNQPVISTRNAFSTPRLTPLACV
jgi:Fe-S-cluster-containing dehydrogenase component